MLTPDQIQAIRQKTGIQPETVPSTQLTPEDRITRLREMSGYKPPITETVIDFMKETGPTSKAQLGGIETLIPNIESTIKNIPSSTRDLARSIISPINPLDTESQMNIGANIAKGGEDVVDIFKTTGIKGGIKAILGGFADTYMKIGEKIYGGLDKAYNALLDNPKEALRATTETIAKIGIEDPMFIPSLLYAPNKLAGKEDLITKFASPITRGADTSLLNIERQTEKLASQAGQKISEKMFSPLATKVEGQVKKFADKATQNYADDLSEFFTGTKRGVKIVSAEATQGKNSAEFLARKLQEVPANERVNYIPKVENGTFNPKTSVDYLRRDAETLDSALDDILASEGKIVDIETLRQQMLKEVATDFRMKRAEVEDAQRIVNETIGKYMRQYGDKVDLTVVQKIKQGLYSKGYADFDPTKGAVNLQKSVSRDMARVAKQTIEDNVDDFNTKVLNNEIGNHYSAIDTLEKMSGNKVKGGRLGRFGARIIGSVGGSQFGFLGALTGAVGADMIAQFLIDTSISGPIRNALIKRLTQTNPKLLEEALRKVNLNKGNRLLPEGRSRTIENNVPIQMRGEILDEKGVQSQVPRTNLKNTEATINPASAVKNIDDSIPQNREIFYKQNRGKVEELRTKASKSKLELDNVASELAKKYGGRTGLADIKKTERILEKSFNEYAGDISQVKDIIRNSITMPESNIPKALKEIGKDKNVVRIKPQKTPLGYKGNIINYKTSNGTIGEIQITSPDMIYGKFEPEVAKSILGDKLYAKIKLETGLEGGKGHLLYEKYRVLGKKDFNRAIELLKESKKYYRELSKKVSLSNKLDLQSIAKEINNSGITFNINTNSNLGGQKLFSVGVFPEKGIIEQEKLTVPKLLDFISKNESLLKKNGMNLGGWFDTQSKQVYLDVSYTTKSKAVAKDLGKNLDQKSIFDLNKFKEISTGGTGNIPKNVVSSKSRLDLIKNIENKYGKNTNTK